MEKEIQDELELKISELWRHVKPSYDAQQIRAKLSTAFDSAKSKDGWLGDHAPDYVWSLIDIAAQWGIEHGRKAEG
jgi:hypothetical protein